MAKRPASGEKQAILDLRRRNRDNERRLRNIINHNADGILVLDERGRVLFANPAAGALLGAPPSKLRGQHFGLPSIMGEATEVDINHAGQPPRVAEMRTVAITWQGKRAALASLRDITERKQTEIALRESEMRYRQIFEAALTGNYVASASGRVLACNGSFLRTFGFADQAAAGTLLLPDLFENAEDFERILRSIRVSGKLSSFETSMRNAAGGTVRVIQNAFGSFDERGGLTSITGYVLDLTERISLEEQLRHAQKMEAVGRLAGGVAHDFNNLLTVIAGHTALLGDSIDTEHELRDSVDAIVAATTRASALTSRLLTFSRRQQSQPTNINLNEVLANVGRLLRPALGDSVELRLGLCEGEANIRADLSQIEQMVMNLAVNAHDAMAGGGRLVIETSKLEVDEAEAAARLPGLHPGPYLLLTVTDTGHGMSRDVLSRVFEPFFTTKDPTRGTGLGLSIVYGIVKQHNGEILCTSEPGQGTCFRIYLPRVKAEARRDTRREPARETSSGQEYVLLVDDEVAVRKLVRTILMQKGYRVIEAPDQEEALRIAISRNIDLLLTDVAMPGMTGPQLAKLVCARRPSARVLYMSGYSADAMLNKGLLQPGVAFIAKPFTRQELWRKVRELLDSPRVVETVEPSPAVGTALTVAGPPARAL